VPHADRDQLLDLTQGARAGRVRAQHRQSREPTAPQDRSRSAKPQIIKTVWDGGYMLAADVKRI